MTDATYDVIVVGGANTDYLGRGAALPRAGETLNGDLFQVSAGGKGANQAVAAARLGARVLLVAAVGADERGNELAEQLRSERVDIGAVVKISEAVTGAALIHVDRSGEKQILALPGANRHLTSEHVRNGCATVGHARAVVAQLEVPLESVIAAFTWARSTGARTILDPAPAIALGDDVLRLVDVIKPNAREAEVLTGVAAKDRDSARRAARQLLQRGVGAVIVQAGDEGNLLVWPDGEHWLPKLPVTAVDATGAGDALAGTLATYLARGRSLVEASSFANAAAALATTAFGAQAGLPDETAIVGLLERVAQQA